MAQMATLQRIFLLGFSVAGLLFGCGDPAPTSDKRIEFVPGRYRAELIEIDSDCEPRLEDILAVTKQPAPGIVELLWRDIGNDPLPELRFSIADPRLASPLNFKTTTRCDRSDPDRPACLFLPGEQINETTGSGFSSLCTEPILGVIPNPEVKIRQGPTRGVLEVEVTHPWTEPLVSSNGCRVWETYPRTECTERIVLRYTLVRECPLNCTAIESGFDYVSMDIFPEREGYYRDFRRPEELYECVPFDTREPLIGECPEEYIVP